MSLIHEVLDLCAKLSNHGWRDLLRKGHGLDIGKKTPAALARELARPLEAIDRSIPGFEDFAAEGRFGVEPGSPARNLLYHALASPNVLNRLGKKRLGYFPTLAELELVENYVFSVKRPGLAALFRRMGRQKLGIVVFACEYWAASQTCHGRHADMVYSRTGIGRVGTAEAEYEAELRGYMPHVKSDPFAIRALPARYAAYLSVRLPGDPQQFIPMRFRDATAAKNKQVRKPDDQREFWVPIYNLFSGTECLADEDLVVDFSSHHFNQKIYRVHEAIGDTLPSPEYPYQFSDGIAELSTNRTDGHGMLAPVPHARLVEPARTRQGGWATYPVTAARIVSEYSSFSPKQATSGPIPHRSAPQYVNAKVEVLPNGTLVDLNDDPRYETLKDRATAGAYRVLHFVDFTGEGWVQVECPQLAGRPETHCPARPADSLVTAPDFFPLCDQRELIQWTESPAVPPKLRKSIWWVNPDALSDQRFPANLQLPLPQGENPFDPTEDSVTALVPLLGTKLRAGRKPPPSDARRHSHLPDDSAGVFDPGWDVSLDTLGYGKTAIEHFAAYGLGSPFAEDAKLCAALGTFWPSVSPDTTRVMEPLADSRVHTTSPLTDDEVGQIGNLAWDGVAGPRVVEIDGKQYAEFADSHHVDYVRNALRGQFTLRLTAQVDRREYENRVLAMSLIHRAISAKPNRWSDWIVLSFRVVRPAPISPREQQDLDELREAQRSLGVRLRPRVYRFEMFTRRQGGKRHLPGVAPYDFRKRLLPIVDRRVFFVAPPNQGVLWRPTSNPQWKRKQVTQ